jgi:hypothetical protein
MYILLSRDPYKYVITTSIKRISKLSVTTKLIKNINVIASTTGEYVFSQSIPSFCRKPYATSLALYLTILIFSLHFLTNTHLYSTSDIPSGVWTTGPNTSRFASEFKFCLNCFLPHWPNIFTSTFFDDWWVNINITSGNVKCNFK